MITDFKQLYALKLRKADVLKVVNTHEILVEEV